jgi:hypothetical protein
MAMMRGRGVAWRKGHDQFQTVHVRHVDVGDDQVVRISVLMGQAGFGVGRRRHSVAGLTEHLGGDFANGIIIVDEKDAGHGNRGGGDGGDCRGKGERGPRGGGG